MKRTIIEIIAAIIIALIVWHFEPDTKVEIITERGTFTK
jgi:hypothetical protein